MVHAFVLHTLLPGTCKVLFYQLYGIDSNQLSTDEDDSEIRAERKRQIEYVASQVGLFNSLPGLFDHIMAHTDRSHWCSF